MFKGRSSISLGGLLYLWCLFGAQAVTAKKQTTQDLIGQYAGALTDSGDYLYGSNKWGDDGSGSQNMTVLLADDNGASFNASWVWEKNIEYVHSYPNVGYQSAQIPTQISNIKSFHLSGSWSVYPSSSAPLSGSEATDALNAIACKANVAVDIFADKNKVSSTNASMATHEIMIWQNSFGGVWPIGYYEPPTGAPEYNLSGATYQLFSGFNQQGQKQAVFSWVPKVYQETIDMDVSELLNELVRIGNITDDLYLGILQFGSETVHAAEPVEFQMKDIKMSIGVSSTQTASPTAKTTSSKGAADMWRPQMTNFAMPAALGVGAMLVI